jgi:hypothetical protein
MREIQRRNGLSMIKRYGKVPNCGSGVKSGSLSSCWKGGKPKCAKCGNGLSSYVCKICKRCYVETLKGSKHSDELRIKRSAALPKGPRHHNWKGGITKEREAWFKRLEYKLWRTRVLNRDKWTCQQCGCKKQLQAHHLIPWSQSKELRFAVSNGLTLCFDCHKLTDSWGVRKN